MSDIRTSALGGIPFGTNSQRPISATTGQPYFNGEAGRLELYTTNGWANIVQEVPGISSVVGQYLESNQSNTIQIYGTNFVSGAIAYATGTNGVEIQASSTAFVSLVQLSATFSGLSSAYEPYDIKVVNPSNLFGILPDGLFINQTPIWSTASGSLGTTYSGDTFSFSVAASDPESGAITYASSNKPSWVSLNTSTGALTGTAPTVLTDTSYSFNVTASDGNNTSAARSFSITVGVTDGSTQARAALSPKQLKSLGITASGAYWFKNAGYNSGTPFAAYADLSIGDGYIITSGIQLSSAVTTSYSEFGTAATSATGTIGYNSNFNLATANLLTSWTGDTNNRFIVGMTDRSGTSINSANGKHWFAMNLSPAVAKTWFDNSPATGEYTGNVVVASSSGNIPNSGATFWTSGHGGGVIQFNSTSSGNVNSNLWMELRDSGTDSNHSAIVWGDGTGSYYAGGAPFTTRWMFMGFSPGNM